MVYINLLHEISLSWPAFGTVCYNLQFLSRMRSASLGTAHHLPTISRFDQHILSLAFTIIRDRERSIIGGRGTNIDDIFVFTDPISKDINEVKHEYMIISPPPPSPIIDLQQSLII